MLKFKTKSKTQERHYQVMYNYFYDHLKFMFRYFLLNYYIEEFYMIIHFLQMLENQKNNIQTDQLVCYADFSFMITLSSYSVKSDYFNIIFNLLRLL